MVLFAYVVFAILQTSFTLPANPATPFDELNSVLPIKEIQDVKAKHLKDDPTFQAAVKYFKSPEWIKIIEDVRKTPEWIEYKNFLKEATLDLDALIKHVDHCFNATDVKDIKVEGVKPSLANFIQDVKTTYGIQIIKGLQEYLVKSANNEGTKKMREQIMSPKSKEMLEKALEQPALQKTLRKLKDMDVDVNYILMMFYTFSGWEPTTIVPA